MTKQELIEKGITLDSITAMMRRAEKLIAFYNCKYNFDRKLATAAERREWNSALNRWDTMNAHRNILRACA